MNVQVVGSINVDTILSVLALPGPGETVLASAAQRLPGGKGANQAVAAARMGAAVRMQGAVGADGDGQWMRSVLTDEGIATDHVHSLQTAPTGSALIAVDLAGENQIIVAPGANAAFGPDIACLTEWSGVTLAQLEVPVETIAATFSAATGPRILNAAPFIASAASLFSITDILVVNQHELSGYLGGPAIGDATAAMAARALISRADQAIVVTLGAGGAVAVWHDRFVFAPAIAVKPVDTVGAGDCFCGALAALVAEGVALADALPLANAAAALCTQTQGAVPAMPWRAAAEAMLAVGPTEYA